MKDAHKTPMTLSQKLLNVAIWIILVATCLGLGFLLETAAQGQQTIAPFYTNQANTNLYVKMGQGSPYSTIHLATVKACTSAASFTVILLPGANPSDTISGQTGVCSGATLIDYTAAPAVTYKGNGTGYVAQGSGGGGPPTGAAGGDLNGSNYPNPIVSGLKNVPFCNGFTPTNGQAITLTTSSAPNPCWTAVTPSGGGGSAGTQGQVQAAGSTPGTFQITSCTDNGTTYACAEQVTAPSFVSGTPSAGAKAALPAGAHGLTGDSSSTASVGAAGVVTIRLDPAGAVQRVGTGAESPLCTPLNGACPTGGSLGQLSPSSAFGSFAMASWLQALHNSTNTATSLKNFGDSFSIASQQNSPVGPTLTSDLWIEQVRIALQAKYGSHGTGIVPILITAGTSNVNSTAWAVTGTNSAITTLGPEQGGSVAGGSLYQLGTGAVLTFHDTRGISWDTFHLYYATSVSSGNLALFSTDLSTSLGTANAGSAAATGAVSGGLTASRFDATAIASGTHTITIACSASPCYVWGAQGVAGTTGVEVSNIAIGSAAAEMFASLSTVNQMAFTDLDPVSTGGFVTMLQTNEPGVGYSTSSFNAAMTAIVSHEQALSAANPPSGLLIIPPQGSIGTGTLPAYTAVQVALCGSLNVNCQNVQDRWGATFDSTTGLWSNDGACAYCHPTTKGDLDMATVAYAGVLQPNPTSASGGCTTNCTITGTGGTPGLSVNSAADLGLVVNSTGATTGSSLELKGSGSNIDSWVMTSGGNGIISGGKIWLLGDLTTGDYGLGVTAVGGVEKLISPAGSTSCWTSFNVLTACDTGLSRTAAGALALGNGTGGDSTGSLALATIVGHSNALAIDAATTVDSGSNNNTLTMKSSSNFGTFLSLQGTGTLVDNWILASAGDSSTTGGKVFLIGDLGSSIYSWAQKVDNSGAGFIKVPSLMANCWSSTASVTANACDTGLSRDSPGVVDVGNGSQGDKSGTINAAQMNVNGGGAVVYICAGGTFDGLLSTSSGACTGGTGTATHLSIN